MLPTARPSLPSFPLRCSQPLSGDHSSVSPLLRSTSRLPHVRRSVCHSHLHPPPRAHYNTIHSGQGTQPTQGSVLKSIGTWALLEVSRAGLGGTFLPAWPLGGLGKRTTSSRPAWPKCVWLRCVSWASSCVQGVTFEPSHGL